MARNRGSYGRANGPNVLLIALIGLGVVALVGGGIFYVSGQQGANETNEATGCLKNRPTPESVLVLVDQTDKLTRENAERIKTHILDNVNQLPRFSRVIVVPFGEDVSAPLKPVFDHCVPGRRDDATVAEGSALLERKHQEFEATISNLSERLVELPDASRSPITEQVVRAASDEVLHWAGTTKRMYLVTDGLQSSIYWTKSLALPDAPEGILNGVKVEYFEIGNSKNGRFQTRNLREEWRRWLSSAGAEVRMHAPGYPAN